MNDDGDDVGGGGNKIFTPSPDANGNGSSSNNNNEEHPGWVFYRKIGSPQRIAAPMV